MPDLATRLANTGQLLVYSGIEIDRILSDMVNNQSAISASLPGHEMFLSRLLVADPVKQRLCIAQSDSKETNAALLESASVSFRCHHRFGQFAFSCRRPRQTSFAGQPAIQMDTPNIVLAVQHNKKAVRAPVPKAAPDLRCQLPIGLVSVEARLVDMSLDGHAFLLGDPAIPLCAGTWVRGARITPQGEGPVCVDIELKYVLQTVLPDGERATRIGCRIVGASDAMEKLVARFVIDCK
jgi:c-di-GMP-binding flagellar brake protein YcgR